MLRITLWLLFIAALFIGNLWGQYALCRYAGTDGAIAIAFLADAAITIVCIILLMALDLER